MQYAALFRRLREDKGLTHEALARLGRCHRNTVINVEAGKPVRFATLAGLMTRMGYATDSAEMTSMALLWLEAVSGINLADPATLGGARQKAAVYTRSARQAAVRLAETVQRAGLTDRQIRLLDFAARRPEMLKILESIRDLLPGDQTETAHLKVAEDK
ncbi:MAG TPA: helix-turn-helix transcriptional regulator [Opitutaceae bacterium]|nr:helix-turn-helix transcriptional regulator [Opitutaceae bacterium]